MEDMGSLEDAKLGESEEIQNTEEPVVENQLPEKVPLTALEIPDEMNQDVAEDKNASIPGSGSVTPTYLVPSLRGRLAIEGITHVCRGEWALSDDHHGIPGQTSEFEFKLMKPSPDNTRAFPMNGRYQGYFFLKQPPPLKSSLKIEDKDMIINFNETANGEFAIDGEGCNKFGKFTLRGTLSVDGRVQMFRVYVSKPLAPKKASSGPNTPGSATRKRTIDVASESPRAASGAESARTRKKISTDDAYGSDVSVVNTQVFSPRQSIDNSASTPRAPRLSQHLIKCGEMLKEMLKQPQSVWFQEPVDHVKLNIPDYPNIIKEPMDLGTIRSNLEKNVYSGPESFAEHVRLVFKNALTYNQMRDHPVHIAAREMSSKFEERYRLLLSQLGLAYTSDSSLPSAKKNKATPRLSNGGVVGPAAAAGAPKGRTSYAPVAGPRAPDVFLPPPLDSSAHHLAELQRRIDEMHNEIMRLRSEVKQNELRMGAPAVEVAPALSLDEKHNLIVEIGKLPPNKMVEVVEIIRQVLPPDSSKEDSDEIEIPLDELDTATLRKLQKFVAAEAMERKKKAAANNRSANSGNSSNKAKPKKVTKPTTPANDSSSQPHQPTDIGNNDNNMDMEAESAELLFSSESFDDLRSGLAINHGTDSDDEEI